MNALFPEPPRAQRQLSRLYSEHHNYARPEFKPRYVKITNKVSLTCDECFATQHETGGASGQRLEAKVRRQMKKGAHLNLCRIHEELWKRRDLATDTRK